MLKATLVLVRKSGKYSGVTATLPIITAITTIVIPILSVCPKDIMVLIVAEATP